MRLMALTKDGIDGLLHLVYPPACSICGKRLSSDGQGILLICSDCLMLVKKNRAPYCMRCGRSLRGHVDTRGACIACSGRDFHYERSWSCLLYEGAVKEALHLFKYSGMISFINLFGDLLIQFLTDNELVLEGMDAILAVPLHPVKRRERGFNQAELLTAAIIARFALQDVSRSLRRRTATRPQHELDRKERYNNVRGVFEVINPALVCGKNLLIIDDLFTTGATMNECARVLKKAGAHKIHCLTLARGS